jgi:hypothetical protein
MAESTILRTEKMAKKKKEQSTRKIAMAKLYLYKAVDINSKGKKV